LKRLNTSRADPEYDVLVVRVNAADYGAAQKRHRVAIVGIRRELDVTLVAPAPTHSRERLLWDQWITGEYWRGHGVDAPAGPASDADRRLVGRLLRRGEPPSGEPWRTVRDAIRGLPEPVDGQEDSTWRNHVGIPGARVYAGHTGNTLDRPAKAVKAGDHGCPGGEHVLVRDDGSLRYFTVREVCRLQGFPDDVYFTCSRTEAMRQLGNAVPVPVAETFGGAVAAALVASSEADAAYREVAATLG
jgi:DNA (cytosine-5)-methyltransferase 1